MDEELLLDHDGEREKANEKLSSNIVVVMVGGWAETIVRMSRSGCGEREQAVVVSAITWAESRVVGCVVDSREGQLRAAVVQERRTI